MTTYPLQTAARPALRPLALPAEHGGWGFLFEPILLGLLVRPSWAGALVAVAALFGFLIRHPLKLALQDLLRDRSYPRTMYCWIIAGAYAAAAAIALAAAVSLGGLALFIPLGLVAPLALTQVLYDANNRSRMILPELSGAAAMSSIAAAIAIAGGMRLVPALGLAGVIVARTIPSISYVRTLLQRSHGKTASSWPALALHLAAFAIVYYAPWPVAIAILLLLVRAMWGLAHEPPRATTIGWREIVFGVAYVGIAFIAYRYF